MDDGRYAVEVKSLLESPATMAFTLYLVMHKKYDEEWLGWEPLTVYLELRDEFRAEPATEVMDRLSAIQLVMSTSSFYDDLYAFMGVCNTLADGSPSFDVLDPATVAEMAWAMTEIGLMREHVPFAPTIVDYMKNMLEMEGLDDDPPEILQEVVMPTPDLGDSAAEYADSILHMQNKDAVELFIDEQLALVIAQLRNLELDDEFLAALADETSEVQQ